ncbi:MAG: hypothetical protein GY765_02465 [bacterium]|nr:hypothetical protein [bacterium]
MEYTPTWLRETERKGIEKGIEKGMEKGIEKGIEKGKLETARALQAEGISMEVIAKCIGMTEVELGKQLKLPRVH